MHPHALHAITAAKLVRKCGFWSAYRYCQRRNVPTSLLTLARQLEAVTTPKGSHHGR